MTDQFDNGNNLYYLHQSDNLRLHLVSRTLLFDNYNTWHHSMIMALSTKNKLVDCLNAWTRTNNLVTLWIINAISKDIAASLLYHTSTTEIWKDLESCQKLVGFSQGQMSITTFCTQLKIIWDELYLTKQICSCLQRRCGVVRNMLEEHQQEYVMTFLMGLKDFYAHIRSQILLMVYLPSISKVFSLVF
ncbi:hypothetical protein ES332_D02G202000v1 [Gossypium tomentosum]|uniref:Retrotransposon Copia-like N-terminal domain-containing protein n=1 Tax=Gossypium tomentosum TaxID=34277 RepID=A0A5D2LZP5_GOSTO|nr:hypothetical protein ES332_D02G202000v1 [Gossypium tomentosum]